jgi:hypothetical protein
MLKFLIALIVSSFALGVTDKLTGVSFPNLGAEIATVVVYGLSGIVLWHYLKKMTP